MEEVVAEEHSAQAATTSEEEEEDYGIEEVFADERTSEDPLRDTLQEVIQASSPSTSESAEPTPAESCSRSRKASRGKEVFEVKLPSILEEDTEPEIPEVEIPLDISAQTAATKRETEDGSYDFYMEGHCWEDPGTILAFSVDSASAQVYGKGFNKHGPFAITGTESNDRLKIVVTNYHGDCWMDLMWRGEVLEGSAERNNGDVTFKSSTLDKRPHLQHNKDTFNATAPSKEVADISSENQLCAPHSDVSMLTLVKELRETVSCLTLRCDGLERKLISCVGETSELANSVARFASHTAESVSHTQKQRKEFVKLRRELQQMEEEVNMQVKELQVGFGSAAKAILSESIERRSGAMDVVKQVMDASMETFAESVNDRFRCIEIDLAELQTHAPQLGNTSRGAPKVHNTLRFEDPVQRSPSDAIFQEWWPADGIPKREQSLGRGPKVTGPSFSAPCEQGPRVTGPSFSAPCEMQAARDSPVRIPGQALSPVLSPKVLETDDLFDTGLETLDEVCEDLDEGINLEQTDVSDIHDKLAIVSAASSRNCHFIHEGNSDPCKSTNDAI